MPADEPRSSEGGRAGHRHEPSLATRAAVSRGARAARRRSRAALAAVAFAIAALAVVLVVAGAQAQPAPSAAALLQRALADGVARGSMHEAETAVASKLTINVSADLALSEGRQDITHSGGEQAHILVVANTAYFSGNQTTLVHYFGLPASVAKTVGSKWVSVPSSSSGYATVALDVTLASALKSLTPPGALSETAPTRIDGQSVIGVRGTPGAAAGKAASDVLYVTTGNKPLPVAVAASSKGGGSAQAFTSTITLSAWGEHVAVSAPTNVIPASKL